MRILVISDTHGVYPLPRHIYPDLVLVLGDVEPDDIEEIDTIYNCPKMAVFGNHNHVYDFQATSFIELHEKVIDFQGLKIAGFGGSPRYNTRTFGQYDEWEAENFMKTVPYVDIFVAHSNPQWELNIDEQDPKRGFKCFADYIEQKKPRIFLHGHLHQPEKSIQGKTHIYSVYPFLELKILK